MPRTKHLMLIPCDVCGTPSAVHHGHARCIRCTRIYGVPQEVQRTHARQESKRRSTIRRRSIVHRSFLGQSVHYIARALHVPIALVERVLRGEEQES